MINPFFIGNASTLSVGYQKKFSLALQNWQLVQEEEKSVKETKGSGISKTRMMQPSRLENWAA